jgi:hypothetical protein
MSSDPVAELLAEALVGLIQFVEQRPEEATADDDVAALEDVAATLLRADESDRVRLVGLLGEEHSEALGLTEPPE